MTIEDRLIEAVEGCTIDPGSFGHEAHVRLAFAYLCRYDLFEALDRCRGALRALAEHVGKAERYHETVTCALVFLIHERLASTGGHDWAAFAAANPDLLRWKDGLFFDYYPDDVLESDLARRAFVLPHPAPGVRWPSRAVAGGSPR